MDCDPAATKAVGLGRYYLFSLAAAGQAGVERALNLMLAEIVRDMKLMGVSPCRNFPQATFGSGYIIG